MAVGAFGILIGLVWTMFSVPTKLEQDLTKLHSDWTKVMAQFDQASKDAPQIKARADEIQRQVNEFMRLYKIRKVDIDLEPL